MALKRPLKNKKTINLIDFEALRFLIYLINKLICFIN